MTLALSPHLAPDGEDVDPVVMTERFPRWVMGHPEM